jgi:hypothetical protein
VRRAAVALLAAVLAGPSGVVAEAPGGPGPDEREQRFLEGLRAEDPTSAARYATLRDARAAAVAELQRVEAQYQAAGPELRGLFVSQVRQARRTYAETSLALLDFLDARYRRAVASYQDEISRIDRLLAEHARLRAELEKILSGD